MPLPVGHPPFSSYFRRFTGLEQQNPCFTGWNADSSFSPFSSKTPFFWRDKSSGVNKSARERIGRQDLSQKLSSKKGSLWESYFLQGIIGKTHTQNLQILREDTLGASCSAGPFCLLPKSTVCQKHRFRDPDQ